MIKDKSQSDRKDEIHTKGNEKQQQQKQWSNDTEIKQGWSYETRFLEKQQQTYSWYISKRSANGHSLILSCIPETIYISHLMCSAPEIINVNDKWWWMTNSHILLLRTE